MADQWMCIMWQQKQKCVCLCVYILPDAWPWWRRVKRRRTAEAASLLAREEEEVDEEEEEEDRAIVWDATIPWHIFSSSNRQDSSMA